jgi:hypothetical protein
VIIIILGAMVIFLLIRCYQFWVKANKYIKMHSYMCMVDKEIMDIVFNKKATNEEKIKAIKWHYDNIPF